VFETFSGKLTLQDGSIIEVVLTLGTDNLTITADRVLVGAWPLKYCKVARRSRSMFALSIDGEPTVFEPIDEIAFAKAAARRFEGTSLADRIDVMRTLPPVIEERGEEVAPEPAEAPREPSFTATHRIPIVLASTVVAVGVLVAVAGWRGADLAVAPTTQTTVPASTTASTVPLPPAFMLTADGLAMAWDNTAIGSGSDLLIGKVGTSGRFQHEFTEWLRIDVGTSVDDTVSEFTVTAEATHPDYDDRKAVEALDIAIRVARPDATPFQRRELLQQLGFFSADSFATGSATADDVSFELTYLVGTYLLRVSPG
jgi:hypothetical protein